MFCLLILSGRKQQERLDPRAQDYLGKRVVEVCGGSSASNNALLRGGKDPWWAGYMYNIQVPWNSQAHFASVETKTASSVWKSERHTLSAPLVSGESRLPCDS